jgi:2-amino-4-hydroxy-6-hydroxymethyldihydropteridine diphosphokinase
MGICSRTFLNAAMALEKEGIRFTGKSSLYLTRAWGNTNQNDFLNQVWIAETTLSPEELLSKLKTVETLSGRRNREKWQPRPLDIDILFFDDRVVSAPGLKIPHPFIAERKFVLIPLAEVLSGMVHPETGKTIQQMLMECTDTLAVTRLSAHAESI